jgi:hypothetical protein
VHGGCLRRAPGGSQTAFASLVDPKTGDLVWFNYMQSNEGDIHAEGADVSCDLPRQHERQRTGE